MFCIIENYIYLCSVNEITTKLFLKTELYFINMEKLNELYAKRDKLHEQLESIQYKIDVIKHMEKQKTFIEFYNKIKDHYIEIDLYNGDKVFGYVDNANISMSVINLTNILKICDNMLFFIPESGFLYNEIKSLDAKILTLDQYKARIHEIVDKYLPK